MNARSKQVRPEGKTPLGLDRKPVGFLTAVFNRLRGQVQPDPSRWDRYESWDSDAAVWGLDPVEYAHYLSRISRYYGRRSADLARRAAVYGYRAKVSRRASLVFLVLSPVSFTVDWSMYGVVGMVMEVVTRAG